METNEAVAPPGHQATMERYFWATARLERIRKLKRDGAFVDPLILSDAVNAVNAAERDLRVLGVEA